MRELNPELRRSDAPAVRDNMGERVFASIGIEPEAAMRDAAMAFDMGGFDHEQTGARIGQHAEMRQVPIIGDAVIGAVLAHRRHHDAV